jgi:hypothetical protein
MEILENYDKNIKEKTKKEYKEVNYVTLTTLLLDETEIEIKKLEDDFHHHRHNKYYYERELAKIKERLESIRKLRDNDSVQEEIMLLRKELYTKSKDKYDLLYNDEVFFKFQKNCDDLLKKVNRRIIDLKKEKEEKEKDNKEKKDKIEKKREEQQEKKKEKKEKNEEDKELLENILKRFQDMALARQILLATGMRDKEIVDEKGLIEHIDRLYLEFISGERCKFNYERNKSRLELVKLLNGLGHVQSILTHKEFIPFEHINFSMIDLIDYVEVQKEGIDDILIRRPNRPKEENELSILVSNKLNILKETELERTDERDRVLTKKNN